VIRAIKSVLLAGLVALFVLFSVSNREPIVISLFPLAFEAEMPKFLLAILCFTLGLLFGWMVCARRVSRHKRALKLELQRTRALQNEVDSLHHSHSTKM
jgi:uncharacterized integral membrane protein